MGARDGELIDHRDRNKLNNIRTNLRFCDYSSNRVNTNRSRANKSGYKGVSWFKSRKTWSADIYWRGLHYHLGRFPSAREAARVRDGAALVLHGEFAVLNLDRKLAIPFDLSANPGTPIKRKNHYGEGLPFYFFLIEPPPYTMLPPYIL